MECRLDRISSHCCRTTRMIDMRFLMYLAIRPPLQLYQNNSKHAYSWFSESPMLELGPRIIEFETAENEHPCLKLNSVYTQGVSLPDRTNIFPDSVLLRNENPERSTCVRSFRLRAVVLIFHEFKWVCIAKELQKSTRIDSAMGEASLAIPNIGKSERSSFGNVSSRNFQFFACPNQLTNGIHRVIHGLIDY